MKRTLTALATVLLVSTASGAMANGLGDAIKGVISGDFSGSGAKAGSSRDDTAVSGTHDSADRTGNGGNDDNGTDGHESNDHGNGGHDGAGGDGGGNGGGDHDGGGSDGGDHD